MGKPQSISNFEELRRIFKRDIVKEENEAGGVTESED